MTFPRFVASLTLSVLVSCIGCSGSDSGESVGGEPRTDACDALGLKIINGSPCREEESPVVKILVSYSDHDDTLCSGTMITSTDVLTAGHCFLDFGQRVTGITVTAGGLDIPAIDFSIHPNYREGPADVPAGVAIYNDVAVIKLLRGAPVPTVPLVTSGPVLEGDIIAIFGYGIDERDNLGRLRSGEMQVNIVAADYIGAQFGDSGSDTCVGDSGGPAILQFVDVGGSVITGLVGVTSSGDPNSFCEKGEESLFTNLQAPSNLSFIRNVAPGVSTI